PDDRVAAIQEAGAALNAHTFETIAGEHDAATGARPAQRRRQPVDRKVLGDGDDLAELGVSKRDLDRSQLEVLDLEPARAHALRSTRLDHARGNSIREQNDLFGAAHTFITILPE